MNHEKKMPGRFDYIKYDQVTTEVQKMFKGKFEDLQALIKEFIYSDLEPGRSKALVLTKLEEAYMWIGKALRDQQAATRGYISQEERNEE